MAFDRDHVRSTLNDLIETCKDGEQGFREAADALQDSHIRSLFREFAQQRAQYARQLQQWVTNLGGEAETGGSIAGSAHRGWINLKAAITGHSDSAVVSEAERGEDTARKAYEDALNEDLPADIRSIVQRQYDGVKQAHDQVRSLELTFKGQDRTRGSGI